MISTLRPFCHPATPSCFKDRLAIANEQMVDRCDRFTGQNADRIRTGAEELIALSPNLIVVWGREQVSEPLCKLASRSTR
jgi:hypothetical protein